MNYPENDIQLDKPGAGLPFFEGLLIRYWLFPLAVQKNNPASAISLFKREAEKIVRHTSAMKDDDLFTPVLIPRPRGIEDSSRCWSPAMVVEHLLIVGKAIQRIIPQLQGGTRPALSVDIAAVKPSGERGRDLIPEFEQFCAEFVDQMKALKIERKGGSTLMHPWLGSLNAFRWLCLAAGHMQLHRQQIETIIEISREIDDEQLEEKAE